MGNSRTRKLEVELAAEVIFGLVCVVHNVYAYSKIQPTGCGVSLETVVLLAHLYIIGIRLAHRCSRTRQILRNTRTSSDRILKSNDAVG